MDYTLAKACLGATESKKGLNLEDLRKRLSSLYPQYSDFFSKARRFEITEFCSNDPRIHQDIINTKDPYFIDNTTLNHIERSYCRCLMHLSDNSDVNNIYATCSAKHIETKPDCYPQFNSQNIPSEEWNAYLIRIGKNHL